MESTASHERANAETCSKPLEARLSVSSGKTGRCHCTDQDSRDVRQSLTVAEDGSLRCNIAITGEDGTSYVRTDTREGACPCAVLSNFDCVRSLEEIRDGRLIFSVAIPNRECLPDVVGRLRENGFSVSVEQIRNEMQHEASAPPLTDKQREAFETAIEVGYYEQPRGGDLGDIADQLDITASAVSQRLTAVKRRLAKRYARQLSAEPPQ